MTDTKETASAEELGEVLGSFGFGIRMSNQQETLEKWDVANVPTQYLLNAAKIVGKDLPETRSGEFHLNVVQSCRTVTLAIRQQKNVEAIVTNVKAEFDALPQDEKDALMAEWMQNGE